MLILYFWTGRSLSMKSFLKTASRAAAALFAVALITMGVASPAFADDAAGPITTVSITIDPPV